MKLRHIRPGLPVIGQRLMREPGDRKAFDRTREAEQHWRPWYRTARWQALRLAVFLRDNYTCQRTGIVLGGRGNEPDAPVAHHKVKHNGDPALFWDEGNVETVAKAWHDGEGQRQERAEAARR